MSLLDAMKYGANTPMYNYQMGSDPRDSTALLNLPKNMGPPGGAPAAPAAPAAPSAAAKPGFLARMNQRVQDNPNAFLALASGIQGMSHNKNPGFQNAMQTLMTGNMNREQDERATEAAANQANSTIAYFKSIGENDTADAIAANPESAAQITAAWYKNKNTPKGSVQRGDALGMEGPGASRYYNVKPDGTRTLVQDGTGTGTNVNLGGINIGGNDEANAGFKKYSENIGTAVSDWQQTGRSDAYAQLAQMNDAIGALESGEAVTGPAYGAMPDWAKAWFQGDTKQAQDQIEEVVQRNLRTILGAQFTEREGVRLIARAFNDKLSPEQNLERLHKLNLQMEMAADAKDAMSAHFMQNRGNMDEFQGAQQTLQDFHNVFDTMDEQQGVNAPRVTTQAEYDAIPPGGKYVDEDGNIVTKVGG